MPKLTLKINFRNLSTKDFRTTNFCILYEYLFIEQNFRNKKWVRNFSATKYSLNGQKPFREVKTCFVFTNTKSKLYDLFRNHSYNSLHWSRFNKGLIKDYILCILYEICIEFNNTWTKYFVNLKKWLVQRCVSF